MSFKLDFIINKLLTEYYSFITQGAIKGYKTVDKYNVILE